MQRLSRQTGIVVAYEDRDGHGWANVLACWAAHQYVTIQGESWVFSNATCSGAFNGPHCIGGHPASRVVNLRRQRWIDDPICPGGRWEYESVIRKYATTLNPSVRFGVFTKPVPGSVAPPKPVNVVLKYGGFRLKPSQVKRISVPAGQRANMRARPTTASSVIGTLPNGATFHAYQATHHGQVLAGSGTWYGDATGNRWLHITAF